MLEQYYRISEAAGVAIAIQPDGEVHIHACKLSVNRNQLIFDKKITSLKKTEDLIKHLPAKTQVAVNISGKGVLEKQLEKLEDVNETNFSKVLPNANISDFYVQNFISGDRSFISAIRKTEADKWISHLQHAGFEPLMLSLGPFPVYNVTAQLNNYADDLVFNGYAIRLNEQKDWLSVNYNTNNIAQYSLKIETETIDEKLLLPYAAAFQLLLNDKVDAIHTAALAAGFEQLLEEKKIKAYAFLILLVFFVLLLINFFLFSWLNSENSHLADQLGRSAQNQVDIQGLNRQIREKEVLLNVLGWEDNINKSSLIDQVSSLLPREISWTKAEIDPVDIATSRNQKAIVFFARKMRISGNSEKIIPVNEWIARIKTRPWVKNIQLDSYTFNSELNTGQFIISIDY